MSASMITRLRREAKRLGLAWPDVLGRYRQLKEEAIERREIPNAVRELAWQIATWYSPGCWPFWRHGFAKRWGRRYFENDQTAIPNYDTIQQQVGWYFPQYAGLDAEHALFEFLFSPYDRLPAAAELYDRAIADVAAWRDEPQPVTFDYGDNLREF